MFKGLFCCLSDNEWGWFVQCHIWLTALQWQVKPSTINSSTSKTPSQFQLQLYQITIFDLFTEHNTIFMFYVLSKQCFFIELGSIKYLLTILSRDRPQRLIVVLTFLLDSQKQKLKKVSKKVFVNFFAQKKSEKRKRNIFEPLSLFWR